ncbi:hypothetical protein HPP92_008010 [Vanilla planifolia]|uniref:Uncharacterized protein n=1 Tax=Vanilla planifolia TaxID=51239 RepID=A0A835RSI7_VANPL|nr:hypothetical protein HPP92_008010 [Vanilla planifolia]
MAAGLSLGYLLGSLLHGSMKRRVTWADGLCQTGIHKMIVEVKMDFCHRMDSRDINRHKNCQDLLNEDIVIGNKKYLSINGLKGVGRG